jgi:hypothetical protein
VVLKKNLAFAEGGTGYSRESDVSGLVANKRFDHSFIDQAQEA